MKITEEKSALVLVPIRDMQSEPVMDTETSRRLQREYLENRIRSAHPVELVNMLYDVAIDNLQAAIGHLRTHDRLARSRAITKAEEAVEELLLALDHPVDAPFTHTLAGLYRYCLKRMIAGHSQQSEAAFREALSVLSTLAVAWREVKQQKCGEPQAAPPEEEPVPVAPRPANDRYAGYRESPPAAQSRDWSG